MAARRLVGIGNRLIEVKEVHEVPPEAVIDLAALTEETRRLEREVLYRPTSERIAAVVAARNAAKAAYAALGASSTSPGLAQAEPDRRRLADDWQYGRSTERRR